MEPGNQSGDNPLVFKANVTRAAPSPLSTGVDMELPMTLSLALPPLYTVAQNYRILKWFSVSSFSAPLAWNWGFQGSSQLLGCRVSLDLPIDFQVKAMTTV